MIKPLQEDVRDPVFFNSMSLGYETVFMVLYGC